MTEKPHDKRRTQGGFSERAACQRVQVVLRGGEWRLISIKGLAIWLSYLVEKLFQAVGHPVAGSLGFKRGAGVTAV